MRKVVKHFLGKEGIRRSQMHMRVRNM